MNRILVIGSAVADVVITLPHLPVKGEDVHVGTQHMNLGGCGMNTYDTMRHLHADAIPFFPIGKGAYGDFVREQFRLRGITTPVPDPDEENGCCYCFIEDDGERTFLSYHGAEYRFRREWFDMIDPDEIGFVYICGLEIEEKTGINIVEYLEQLLERNPSVKIFFAPGPRITKIDPALIMRILKLHPVLHLNRAEASHAVRICLEQAGAVKADLSKPDEPDAFISSVRKDASELVRITGSPVIITLGENGCCYADDKDDFEHIPAVAVAQVDTNGAGDAHIGTVIASLQAGKTLREALITANKVSSVVVGLSGATIPDELFPDLTSVGETPASIGGG